MKDEAPIDVANIVYFIMFWEGVGNLFPWNAFITASSYYAERFCGTQFEDTFENYFSITYTLSQTVGLAVAVLIQDKLTMQQKIASPLILYSIIFGITTLLVTIKDMDPALLFYITIISAFMSGMVGAILSGGLFSLGAMLPATYTGALMNGQGMAGLTVSMAALLTQLAYAPDDDCGDDGVTNDDGACEQSIDYSALAYFLIATIVLVTCFFAFYWLRNLSFTKYYISRAKMDESPLLHHVDGTGEERHEEDMQSHHGLMAPESSTVPRYPTSVDDIHLTDSEKQDVEHIMTKVWNVYKQIMIPSLSVIFTFTVTIGLFPSLTVFIESTEKCKSSERFYNDLFVPFLFLLFNLFDLAGRILVGMTKPIFTDKNIWIGSGLRVVFFPLFMLCNMSTNKLANVFNHDACPIIFMILFALTNGYVASSCMVMGASAVKSTDAPLAGTMMVLSLTLGLLGGACVAFLVVFISQGKV